MNNKVGPRSVLPIVNDTFGTLKLARGLIYKVIMFLDNLIRSTMGWKCPKAKTKFKICVLSKCCPYW